MKTNRPITIVMYVQDETEAREFLSPFFEALRDGRWVGGSVVTAVGWDDAYTELEKLEEELEQLD